MRTFDEIFVDKTKYGTKIQTEAYQKTGKYIVVDQGQKKVAGYTDLEDGVFDDVPAIVFGDHTRIIKYVEMPFFLGADGVKVLKSKEADANYKYLYYALKNAKIPDTGYNRHFKWLKEVDIKYPSLDEQNRIVKVLDNVSDIIEARKQELEELDNLIKSRFVELFGECNSYEKLGNADVIISDGNYSSKYPTADEFVDEGVPFIRASNMVNNTITDEEMYFISEEKHAELLKGHVKPYDVLIATRGAGIGKIAVVPELHDDSNINAQIVLLRCNFQEYNPLYLSWYLKLQTTQVKIQGLVSGSAQPQLPIKRLIQLELLKPEIAMQNEFADFVHQVTKLKFLYKRIIIKLNKQKG